MVSQSLLAVLERPVQTGQVETSYADLLYVVRELHRQFGGVQLLLRGAAVTAAVDGRHDPPALGPTLRAVAPSPAEGLAALLADGVTVRADLASLTRLGLAPQRLVSGVRPCDAGRLAEELPAYERVWFL
jgi:hypothetical protein